MDQRGRVLEYSDDWSETSFAEKFLLFRTNHVVVEDKGYF
jgi:hypothetical protein